MGLWQRRSRNSGIRAGGNEPALGMFASLKRRMRYMRRAGGRPIKVKDPKKYMHSVERMWADLWADF